MKDLFEKIMQYPKLEQFQRKFIHEEIQSFFGALFAVIECTLYGFLWTELRLFTIESIYLLIRKTIDCESKMEIESKMWF